MEHPFRAKSVHAALCQYMRNRPDVGVREAVLDRILEARNPFDPKAARPPRRCFAFVVLLVSLLLVCFVYFGNFR